MLISINRTAHFKLWGCEGYSRHSWLSRGIMTIYMLWVSCPGIYILQHALVVQLKCLSINCTASVTLFYKKHVFIIQQIHCAALELFFCFVFNALQHVFLLNNSFVYYVYIVVGMNCVTLHKFFWWLQMAVFINIQSAHCRVGVWVIGFHCTVPFRRFIRSSKRSYFRWFKILSRIYFLYCIS